MRATTDDPTAVDGCAVLAAAASALADDGADAVPAVLGAVVRSLGLRSAVLRDASGGLRAVGGEVVHAVPLRRGGVGPDVVVELPVQASSARVATLTVVGARPSQLPLLRGLCAVLGLALTRRPVPPSLPLALLEAAEAEADAVADDLHDGPVQDLVFARLAAEAAVRGGDLRCARDAVQTALQSLRRSLWMLRPRGGDDAGLAPALAALSERLVEAGRPGLLLDVDDAAAGDLEPQAAGVAYRLVQAFCRGASGPVTVALRRVGGDVRLLLDGPGALPAADRWTARARAVGAVLLLEVTGGVVLHLPPPPLADPTEHIEAIP